MYIYIREGSQYLFCVLTPASLCAYVHAMCLTFNCAGLTPGRLRGFGAPMLRVDILLCGSKDVQGAPPSPAVKFSSDNSANSYPISIKITQRLFSQLSASFWRCRFSNFFLVILRPQRTPYRIRVILSELLYGCISFYFFATGPGQACSEEKYEKLPHNIFEKTARTYA
jgi:hypothetical protein